MFSALPAATAITNFQVVSYSTSSASGGNVTATILVRVTGPTGTFVNPFASGISLLERRAAGSAAVADNAQGDAFLRPVTATFTPQFVAPFPTFDNGAQRDYDWTVTVVRPTGSVFNFHALGLNAGFDGLLSRETQITFTASLASTPIIVGGAGNEVF
jgi:hypothetical protein